MAPSMGTGGPSLAICPSSWRTSWTTSRSPLGEIRRVVVSRPDWDTAPHRGRVAGGLAQFGSHPGDDNHQVLSRTSRCRVMRLSVTAPGHSVRPRYGTPAPGVHGDEDGEQGGVL